MKFLKFLAICFCMLNTQNGFSQVIYYVNDNSRAGDILTTSVGSNSNTGSSSSPFQTIQFAVQKASNGDTIFVDAGNFQEQVIIDKGISIIGAGKDLSSIISPNTLVPAPGPFTEIGLIETTQGIGNVHISNLSVTSNPGTSQNIIIQSGGSVKNCRLLNGGQGVFFRVQLGVKTAVIESNFIQPSGVGINCQGSGVSSTIVNNTISNGAGFFAGILAGVDFGPIVQLTIANNNISNYSGYGILANSNNSTFTQNSIVGTAGLAIQQTDGSPANATCNWFGKYDSYTVESGIAGFVNYNPWLSTGINSSSGTGFQPIANSCPNQPTLLNGTALDFDGINDYIEGTNPDLPQSNLARTIEAWINPSTTQDGTIINWGSATTNNGRAGLQFKGGKLYYTGLSNDLAGAINISPNVWTHVAATFDGVTLILYVNGVADASNAKTFATVGTTFRFGSNLTSVPSEFFKGKIDEVRVWNKALTSCDIQNNMKYELRGTESGLVGYYRFNQGIANSNNSDVNVAYAEKKSDRNGGLRNFSLTGPSSNWVSLGGVKTGVNLRKPGVKIYLQRKDTIACVSLALKCVAIPNRQGGTKKYQWELNGSDIVGASKSEFDASSLNNNDTLSCKLTEVTDCGTDNYTSNTEIIKVNLPVYTFIGNGNWEDRDNWSNKAVPPTSLPPCSQIVIGQALTDTCILNSMQFSEKGSKIIILPGRQLKVTQFFTLNDSNSLRPTDTTTYSMGLETSNLVDKSETNYLDEDDDIPPALSPLQRVRTSNNLNAVDLDMPPVIMKQLGNSCSAWAVGYGIMGHFYKIIEGNKKFEPEDKLVSPTYIWNQLNINETTRQHDNDKGISLKNALEFVEQRGVPKWVDMPGTKGYNAEPSTKTIEYALLHKNENFYYKRFTTVDIDQMKRTLADGWPIAVGIKTDQEFHWQTNPAQGKEKFYRFRSGKFLGNHAVVICGYDDSKKAFKIMNSWGPGWGNNGFIWITYDVFKDIVRNELTEGLVKDYLGLQFDTGVPLMYLVYSERSVATVKGKIDCQPTPTSLRMTGSCVSNGATISEKGFCYSTSINPTVGNALEKYAVGVGNNSYFQATFTNLSGGVKYYIRSYLKTTEGIVYGNEDSIIIASGIPYSATIASGNNQQGAANTFLNEPLVVLVKDINGIPVANAKVEWQYSTTGSMEFAETYTDNMGYARNRWKLGLPGIGGDPLKVYLPVQAISCIVKKTNCTSLQGPSFSASINCDGVAPPIISKHEFVCWNQFPTSTASLGLDVSYSANAAGILFSTTYGHCEEANECYYPRLFVRQKGASNWGIAGNMYSIVYPLSGDNNNGTFRIRFQTAFFAWGCTTAPYEIFKSIYPNLEFKLEVKNYCQQRASIEF